MKKSQGPYPMSFDMWSYQCIYEDYKRAFHVDAPQERKESQVSGVVRTVTICKVREQIRQLPYLRWLRRFILI